MSSFNKVFILGRLTRDPEIRYMPSGSPVCDFGIATNRKYTGSDGAKQEEVSFFDITAFGKTAELVCQYLSKGRQALIEGRLKQDRWENNEGQKRSKVKVVAERVTFIGGRGEGDNDYRRSEPKRQSAPSEPEGEPSFMPDDDDVPF